MNKLLLLLMSIVSTQAISQNVEYCGTTELIAIRAAENPGYQHDIDKLFNQAKQLSESKGATAPLDIYQIPVVVHIVYNTPEENISDELVYSQIDRLNMDYRRMNPDSVDTRTEFVPVAADAGIEFYLAGTDPDGNPTNGITRTETTRQDFAMDLFGGGMDEMKQEATGGVAAWDTEKYLNIWVCDLMGSSPMFAVLGYAYPPSTAPNWPANSAATSPELEGVAIHYEVFGQDNPLATGDLSVADKGRTPVHEVGHYLGLRHIWGDALFGDGCAEDDGLDDTPNASANAGQQCVFSNNTCVDSPIDHPDMIENYMDYAEEQCMNLFTQDQVGIMRSMLETARNGLITDPVAPSSVSSIYSDNWISVHPNPNTGSFRVGYPDNVEVFKLELTDLNGRVVYHKTSSFHSGMAIETHNVESGIYGLRVSVDGQPIQTKKVVIQ